MTTHPRTPPKAPASLTARFVRSVASVDREAWNGLLAPDDPPFLEWDWLELLEATGAVGGETGWMPLHLVLQADDRLVAAAPLYVKTHGQGEFIYDAIWADLAARMKVGYYPKLVAASPFTPATGYRFLTRPDATPAERADLAEAMLGAIDRVCEEGGLSSANVLFAERTFASTLARRGYMRWSHQGFVWDNEGYGCYADFLARFRSDRRRNIRREREAVRRSGHVVLPLEGADLSPRLMDRMYDFYVATNEKFGPWSCRYLPREFFRGLLDRPTLASRIMLMAAFSPGISRDNPVAMSFFARKGGMLWGRYWGTSGEEPHLHFEVCYHRAIEYAIEQGLARFDPGMGGKHKALRGFRSVACTSLHRHTDPRLRMLFAANIDLVNQAEEQYIEDMDALLPFAER